MSNTNISETSGPIINLIRIIIVVEKDCIRFWYRSFQTLVSKATDNSRGEIMGKSVLPFFLSCFSSAPFHTGPPGSVVEHPLRDREVVGSNPGRAIPKALKMVPVATLLGAQHYKASTVPFFS